jgi:hypothetical protein
MAACQSGSQPALKKEGRTSFLKKRSKKLLSIGCGAK